MSLINILAILLLILACILPFVIIRRKHKKNERQFLQVLLDYAATNTVTISQFDMLSNQIIGISDSGNRLFFLKRRDNTDYIQEIHLNEIELCYVNKPIRNSIDRNYSAVARIELRFAFHDKTKPEKEFELYNMEYDNLSMTGELQLAEKWHSIANSRLLKESKS